jgi:hypothetical protein
VQGSATRRPKKWHNSASALVCHAASAHLSCCHKQLMPGTADALCRNALDACWPKCITCSGAAPATAAASRCFQHCLKGVATGTSATPAATAAAAAAQHHHDHHMLEQQVTELQLLQQTLCTLTSCTVAWNSGAFMLCSSCHHTLSGDSKSPSALFTAPLIWTATSSSWKGNTTERTGCCKRRHATTHQIVRN